MRTFQYNMHRLVLGVCTLGLLSLHSDASSISQVAQAFGNADAEITQKATTSEEYCPFVHVSAQSQASTIPLCTSCGAAPLHQAPTCFIHYLRMQALWDTTGDSHLRHLIAVTSNARRLDVSCGCGNSCSTGFCWCVWQRIQDPTYLCRSLDIRCGDLTAQLLTVLYYRQRPYSFCVLLCKI